MKTVRSTDQKTSLSDRVSLKLALLFIGSFLAVLILIVGWTLLTAVGDSRDSTADAEVQTPPIVIDPKIESDLTKALSFDAIPASTEVQNPFLDRANIGSNLTVTNSATPINASTTANATTTVGGTGPSRMTTVTRVGPTSPGMVLPDVGDSRTRWDEWVARANRGESVGPESETLGIDDLVPVGYAGGGDRPVEVMLFSLSLCRTFSFPAGTRLFDGQIYQVDQNEVVFINQNGLRRKSYATVETCTKNS
jgi:hypothetical protein